MFAYFRKINSRFADEAGMATAEYAMTTVAACGFAGVLYKILMSDAVQQLLVDLIRKSFTLFF